VKNQQKKNIITHRPQNAQLQNQLQDLAWKYHVMAALPNICVEKMVHHKSTHTQTSRTHVAPSVQCCWTNHGTEPRCRETRWNLLGCPKIANRSEPL